MALRRVLVVNKTFPAVGIEMLKNRVDIDIVSHTDDEANSLPEIKKRIKGTHGLIWNTKHKLTEEILDIAGPQLKCVSTMSSGIDQIDEEALKRRGIPLGNVPTVLDDAVADIAVGVLIAAARRFKEGVAELETGQWKYGVNWMLGQDISNSTVGVIGLGGVGQAIVRRLKGFNVARFIYTGRRDKPEAQSLGVARVTLDALLKESDYVILACPLTSDTKHLINAETLSKMKSNAVLINIARGGVVDQDALYNALKSNQIFAAGLDTVIPEPIDKDHPLVGLPNCYIVPHLGSATIGTRNAMSQISASNVLLGLDGKPMQCPVF